MFSNVAGARITCNLTSLLLTCFPLCLDETLTRRQLGASVVESRRRSRHLFWQPVIDDEEFYLNLICFVIQAELYSTLYDPINADTALKYLDLHSSSLCEQIRRQACLVYHNMYRGKEDRVQIVDCTDQSINGRYGLITGYDNSRHLFSLRLDTRSVGTATFFTGEERAVSGSLLEPVYLNESTHTSARDTATRVAVHPVVITVDCPCSIVHPFTFVIRRDFLDVIDNSLQRRSDLTFEGVRLLVITHRAEDELAKVAIHRSPDFSDVDPLPDSSWPIPEDYQVDDSRKPSTFRRCTSRCCRAYRDSPNKPLTCGPCVNGTHLGRSTASSSLADCFRNESQFDVNVMLYPHDILFELPFCPRDTTFSSSCLQLNELSTAHLGANAASDEVLLKRLSYAPLSVTNQDVFSLYPHESISDTVIDLWSQW